MDSTRYNPRINHATARIPVRNQTGEHEYPAPDGPTHPDAHEIEQRKWALQLWTFALAEALDIWLATEDPPHWILILLVGLSRELIGILVLVLVLVVLVLVLVLVLVIILTKIRELTL